MVEIFLKSRGGESWEGNAPGSETPTAPVRGLLTKNKTSRGLTFARGAPRDNVQPARSRRCLLGAFAKRTIAAGARQESPVLPVSPTQSRRGRASKWTREGRKAKDDDDLDPVV